MCRPSDAPPYEEVPVTTKPACSDSPDGRHEPNPVRFGDLVCVWCLEDYSERTNAQLDELHLSADDDDGYDFDSPSTDLPGGI